MTALPASGGFSALMCISRCWKKSWSSREVNGTSIPTVPDRVVNTWGQTETIARVARCQDKIGKKPNPSAVAIQGDTSGSFIPSVDIKTKVAF